MHPVSAIGLVLAKVSPFSVSTNVREYLPMVLLLVVGGLTGWLWLKIKKQSS